MKKILFLILLMIPSICHSATTISANVYINQRGSGPCLVSSGFPFPPGLVTEKNITEGTIKVIVKGAEVAANVTALRGRHPDGSIRSALIQFSGTLSRTIQVIPAQVIVGSIRSHADPAYVMPTYTIVSNNNIIFPSDPNYITTTRITFRGLITPEKESVQDKLQYTILAEQNFAQNAASGAMGAADYEQIEGMIGLWAKTGKIAYFNYALPYSMMWLQLFTPGKNYSPQNSQIDPNGEMNTIYVSASQCTISGNTLTVGGIVLPGFIPGNVISGKGIPKGTTITAYGSGSGGAGTYTISGSLTISTPQPVNVAIILGNETGAQPEQHAPKISSLATMYLLTGYRLYWNICSYMLQYSQYNITSQATADTNAVWSGTPRTNYSFHYFALIGAAAIDATAPIAFPWTSAQKIDTQQTGAWLVQALINNKWDCVWIPFNSGTGKVPAQDTTIKQGSASGKLLGVYPFGPDIPQRFVGEAMPTTGYLQIRKSTLLGKFAAGVLTGIGATATGGIVDDYRNGAVGVPMGKQMVPDINTITASQSGTTLTVTQTSYTIQVGQNVGIGGGYSGYIVSQLRGTAGGIGAYRLSQSATVASNSGWNVNTVDPTFQFSFTNNWLIDYYLNIHADPRIPGLVEANCNQFLKQLCPLVSGDVGYGMTSAEWGGTYYGNAYQLTNPITTFPKDTWSLAEYARAVSFVLKTVGNLTVNGKTYSQWYLILVSTANNQPAMLPWVWKNFGQYLGWCLDAPWMNAQSSIPAPAIRSSTYYSYIPGSTPDVYRTSSLGLTN